MQSPCAFPYQAWQRILSTSVKSPWRTPGSSQRWNYNSGWQSPWDKIQCSWLQEALLYQTPHFSPDGTTVQNLNIVQPTETAWCFWRLWHTDLCYWHMLHPLNSLEPAQSFLGGALKWYCPSPMDETSCLQWLYWNFLCRSAYVKEDCKDRYVHTTLSVICRFCQY